VPVDERETYRVTGRESSERQRSER